MPHKILLLVVGCGIGGTESHVLELASRMDGRKFNVLVCSLKPLGRVGNELESRGIRVISLEGAGKFDPRVLWRLWITMKHEQPDLVQSFLFWANVTARLMRRLGRKLLVISSYHDEVVQENWLYRLVDRMTMRWTRMIVCCSYAVQRSVASRIGGSKEQFVVIPFGVDASRFSQKGAVPRAELGLKDGVPVVGTVSRLVEPKKGLRFLLEAVAHLERRSTDRRCQVLLVGNGPAERDLRTMSRTLNISSPVIFAGARRDIPQLLPIFDIFVLPSLYEGFGIALLEAMAAGRPIIATAVGGIPEFITHGETGLLIEAGNATALADAIEELLESPERASQIALRGQMRVRDRYGIQAIVRRHEQVYEACLANA